jgi:hypothetical protein
MELPDFPCSGCGQCCRFIGKVLNSNVDANTPIGALIKEFPYKPNANGDCEMLVDGQCSVYEDRPVLCNIKKMSELFYSDDPIGHYLDCAHVCNALISYADLDPSYMIDVEELEELQK